MSRFVALAVVSLACCCNSEAAEAEGRAAAPTYRITLGDGGMLAVDGPVLVVEGRAEAPSDHPWEVWKLVLQSLGLLGSVISVLFFLRWKERTKREEELLAGLRKQQTTALVEVLKSFGNVHRLIQWYVASRADSVDAKAAFESVKGKARQAHDESNALVEKARAEADASKARIGTAPSPPVEGSAANGTPTATAPMDSRLQAELGRVRKEAEWAKAHAKEDIDRARADAISKASEVDAEVKKARVEMELEKAKAEAETRAKTAQSAAGRKKIQAEASLRKAKADCDWVEIRADAELKRTRAEAELRSIEAETEVRRAEADAMVARAQTSADVIASKGNIDPKRLQAEATLETAKADASVKRAQAIADVKKAEADAEAKSSDARLAVVRAQADVARITAYAAVDRFLIVVSNREFLVGTELGQPVVNCARKMLVASEGENANVEVVRLQTELEANLKKWIPPLPPVDRNWRWPIEGMPRPTTLLISVLLILAAGVAAYVGVTRERSHPARPTADLPAPGDRDGGDVSKTDEAQRLRGSEATPTTIDLEGRAPPPTKPASELGTPSP